MLHRLARSGIAVLIVSAGAVAQSTTRVSVDSSGAQANNSSDQAALSSDGRYVAFSSVASNLVAGDTNGIFDVFVYDRHTGLVERVSVDSAGMQGNGHSHKPSLSADGRYVAFMSEANNLVPGDAGGWDDIFVRDRQSGTTERVSIDSGGVQGNGDSRYLSISADGRYVAFQSYASNLVAGDTNGSSDVFVHDRLTGTTDRVTVDSGARQGDAESFDPSISADGRFVAFRSLASNLVAGDMNGTFDIFVHDRQAGTTERVSVDSAGAESNGPSYDCAISADGQFATYYSFGSNLVTADTNGHDDVFVYDRQTGSTERVSVDSAGSQANADCYSHSISDDGRFVAFYSQASNLVAGDSNGVSDVFVHDRASGATERVSIDPVWAQGNGVSQVPAISGDGMCVAFESAASDLVSGDTNGCYDIFIRDRACTGSIYNYCTAKTNSLGCVPAIGSVGVPSQSGPDNFYITATNVLNHRPGMMLWSTAPASNPFFGGTLCLASPIVRTPAQIAGGSLTGNDCTGTYSYHFTQLYMLQHLLASNTTVYAQFWSRDPGFAAPYSIGLTDGLSFTICP